MTTEQHQAISPADRRVKGNELIIKDVGFMQAGYVLDVSELRLVALAILVLRQDSDRAEFDPTVPVTIHANLYAELFGTSRQNAYSMLEQAAKSLENRKIHYVDTYEDKKKNKKAVRYNNLDWTSICSYVPSMGLVQICFTPQIIPFLVHVDTTFAGYEIRNLVKLSTPYEFRLYELGVAWKKTGIATFKKETLRHRLGIMSEDQFKTASNFNKMLNKALKTINTETDLEMAIEANYERNEAAKGRKIRDYTMTVSVKPEYCIEGKAATLLGKVRQHKAAEELPEPKKPETPPKRKVKPKNEDEILSRLGTNEQLKFGNFEEKKSHEPAPGDHFKHHGILKTDQYIRAYPNEDGSWDIEGILKYIDKPIFQIIGMDLDDIPLELIEGTAVYKKAEGKSVILAIQQSKMFIGRKIALSHVRNESGGVPEKGMQRKAKHGRIHLTAKEIEIVMNDGAFRSRYAPVSVSDPSIIREHLKKLLTGDLSKIPDLEDYLRFNTI